MFADHDPSKSDPDQGTQGYRDRQRRQNDSFLESPHSNSRLHQSLSEYPYEGLRRVLLSRATSHATSDGQMAIGALDARRVLICHLIRPAFGPVLKRNIDSGVGANSRMLHPLSLTLPTTRLFVAVFAEGARHDCSTLATAAAATSGLPSPIGWETTGCSTVPRMRGEMRGERGEWLGCG